MPHPLLHDWLLLPKAQGGGGCTCLGAAYALHQAERGGVVPAAFERWLEQRRGGTLAQ